MMIGIECNQRTGEIRDVLAQGKIAFHVDTGKRLVAIELPDKLRGARFALTSVRPRPPARETAIAVILASLIVKRRAHFLTDYCAHEAVIACRIGSRIE